MTDIAAIRAAADRLSGHAVETPLLNAPLLDEVAGRRVFVKAECLQKTGSFKYRGARNSIAALSEDARARGVLAYSSGNHAQGIALAARELGVPAVIIMPRDAPALKLANTRAYGAEIVTYDRPGGESREDIGDRMAADRGLTLIRPYDHPEVIAGQGTAGLEIAAQAATQGVDAAEVFVCCGGGGLTSGIALALASDAPTLSVRPVEPEGFDDVRRSMEVGHILSNNAPDGSICDAILTPAPGHLTFPILQELCGTGVVVSDEEALRAVALAWRRLKIVLEPGGAVALAAALRTEHDGRDVIAVATGGNVDRAVFDRALAVLDD